MALLYIPCSALPRQLLTMLGTHGELEDYVVINSDGTLLYTPEDGFAGGKRHG